MARARSEGMIRDLTEGKVSRQLLMFAGPLMLSGLLQTVYNMVDMVVVGRFVGKTGLSAVSIGGDILQILTFVAMGFSNAGQILISQYIGAGKRHLIQKMIGTLFVFLLLCAIAMTGICLIAQNQLLLLIHTPKEAWVDTGRYMVTCICGLVFIYGYNLVSAILRGMGDSRHPLLFIAIASVCNVILDLIFVGVCGMGTFGAALATVIGQAVSFLCAVMILYRSRESFCFDFKPESFRIYPEVFGPLLALGIPMMIQSAAITFSKLFVNAQINSYGVVVSAVSGIGTKLDSFTNVITQAVSAAGGTMIAQNLGAGKYRRVTEVLKVSFLVNGLIILAMALPTVFAPDIVFGLFTDDAEVLALALTYVPVAIVLYAGCILRPPMFSLINGSGNTKLNLAVAVLDGIVVRIGLALVLGVVCGFGVYGFWFGSAFSGFVPFLIGTVYYISGTWKVSRNAQKKEREGEEKDAL